MLWDIPQTKNELRVSRTTLDRLVKAGELRAVKIGRRVLFHPEEIEDFIHRKMVPNTHNKH